MYHCSLFILLTCCVAFPDPDAYACDEDAIPIVQKAGPLYESTADTVFDIITTRDEGHFMCLEYKGRQVEQIWDKRISDEPLVDIYSFVANFDDGTTIELAINPEFGSPEIARAEAMRYVTPLGQLPTMLRAGIARFSVHKGDEAFHAGTGQIIAYADKASLRIEENHLEETIFHESIHASFDAKYRLAPKWAEAQRQDGRFLTQYGRKVPDREDLAETALFAYAISRHPGRIPPVIPTTF
jgi:hypothetical protein